MSGVGLILVLGQLADATGVTVATVASTPGPIAVGLPPRVLPDLGLISPGQRASGRR